MKLATKVRSLLLGVFLLTVLSSAVTLISTHRISRSVDRIIAQSLSSIRAAEELEDALQAQRGLVAFYILDRREPAWLEELGRRRAEFVRWLDTATRNAQADEDRELVDKIAEIYAQYDRKREEAVALDDRGEEEAARSVLREEIHSLYMQAHELCDRFLSLNERRIEATVAENRRQVWWRNLAIGTSAGLTVLLTLALLGLFYRDIVRPLRRMAGEAGGFTGAGADAGEDDLQKVGDYLHAFMTDVREARSSLEKSRSLLASAEKLASVGKLAAGVAHEIRNPLTSIRMRLFSIRRALGNDPQYEDDLLVVTEEVARLERIVHHFLEFARPPVLRPEAHDVARLIEKTVELVGPQFVEKQVDLRYDCPAGLPPVQADAEQLRQVLLNLLRNAMDAAATGGQVRILAGVERERSGREMVVVRVRDTGPGVPEEIREHIFEPFYSTTEGGTGLGLSIAAQIMGQHGGRIELEDLPEPGAVFAVWIPIAGGAEGGQDSCG